MTHNSNWRFIIDNLTFLAKILDEKNRVIMKVGKMEHQSSGDLLVVNVDVTLGSFYWASNYKHYCLRLAAK